MMVGVINAGDMLMLLIPRDDFAKLMDFIARVENAEHGDRLFDGILIEDIETLSRIAADLNQQVNAQEQGFQALPDNPV